MPLSYEETAAKRQASNPPADPDDPSGPGDPGDPGDPGRRRRASLSISADQLEVRTHAPDWLAPRESVVEQRDGNGKKPGPGESDPGDPGLRRRAFLPISADRLDVRTHANSDRRLASRDDDVVEPRGEGGKAPGVGARPGKGPERPSDPPHRRDEHDLDGRSGSPTATLGSPAHLSRRYGEEVEPRRDLPTPKPPRGKDVTATGKRDAALDRESVDAREDYHSVLAPRGVIPEKNQAVHNEFPVRKRAPALSVHRATGTRTIDESWIAARNAVSHPTRAPHDPDKPEPKPDPGVVGRSLSRQDNQREDVPLAVRDSHPTKKPIGKPIGENPKFPKDPPPRRMQSPRLPPPPRRTDAESSADTLPAAEVEERAIDTVLPERKRSTLSAISEDSFKQGRPGSGEAPSGFGQEARAGHRRDTGSHATSILPRHVHLGRRDVEQDDESAGGSGKGRGGRTPGGPSKGASGRKAPP